MRHFKIWFILFLLAIITPAFSATPVNITFGWDKSSDDTGDVTRPISYRIYVSTTAPVGGVMPTSAAKHEAGQAIELMIPLTAGTYYVAATARWCAVYADGACSGTAEAESGLSNVMQLQVQVPPGNPKNYRVRITGMP